MGLYAKKGKEGKVRTARKGWRGKERTARKGWQGMDGEESK